MKLKKLLKTVDDESFTNVKLYNIEDELLWEGSIITLNVAVVQSKKNRKEYMRDCKLDGSYKEIELVNDAMKFKDCKIHSIYVYAEKNKHDVAIPYICINISQ